MSEPLWVSCATLEDVPPVERLRDMATEAQHAVLAFPASAGGEGEAKKQLIERLERELPDYTVFAPWGSEGAQESRVTVMKTLSEAEVLAHADAIFDAALRFRDTTTERMMRLSEHLGVPLETFASAEFRVPRGRLPDGWEFWFHGFECSFQNRETREQVEVRLGFLNEFGALDPMFFAFFVRSTPGLEPVALLFKDTYHYPARAMDVLQKHGYLVEVSGHDPVYGLRGLVARTDGTGQDS